MSLGLLIYNLATVRFNAGYANAIGVVLLIMGLLAFVLIARVFRVNESARTR